MKILAISTSTDKASVCISENEKLLCVLTADVKKKHSEVLMPLIDQILDLTETKIEDIDLYVCDTGPGSFTGIRIGVSTVNAFMISTGKMTAGISSLDIIAENVSAYNDVTVCIIYARNDQVYGAVYMGKELQDSYFAGSIDEFLEKQISSEYDSIIFTGDGSKIFQDKIIKKFNKKIRFSQEKDDVISAYSLASIAFRKGGSKEYIKPLYLKKSSAKVMRDGKNI